MLEAAPGAGSACSLRSYRLTARKGRVPLAGLAVSVPATAGCGPSLPGGQALPHFPLELSVAPGGGSSDGRGSRSSRGGAVLTCSAPTAGLQQAWLATLRLACARATAAAAQAGTALSAAAATGGADGDDTSGAAGEVVSAEAALASAVAEGFLYKLPTRSRCVSLPSAASAIIPRVITQANPPSTPRQFSLFFDIFRSSSLIFALLRLKALGPGSAASSSSTTPSASSSTMTSR